MNIGNHMQTIEDFYQFLLNHDLVEKVLSYREMYPYSNDDYICRFNPLNDLFIWSATPEDGDYWYEVCSLYRMQLEPTSLKDIVAYLRTRIIQQQEMPYEYW